MSDARLPNVVADVGGTNTRVAIAHGGDVDIATIRRFRNAAHSDLGAVLATFLAEGDHGKCAGTCVAVAGPVMDGIGRLTNLDWVIDRPTLAECTGAGTVAILNDLQAQGHALDHIAPASLKPIVEGPAEGTHDAKLVIGCGTGFNAVPVFRTETGRYVPPCECGHATLPVLSDEDVSLARYVTTAHGFPGIEDVLSGRGFERVYAWASGEDRRLGSAEIMAAIEDGSDPDALRAAKAFCRTFGRVTGDLALTHLPFGGIYLIGGMTQALAPHLVRFGFAEAMRTKGRFSTFMERFAVWTIEDDYAALTGCAHHLSGLMDPVPRADL
ncbi:glucokinase [Palleronia aestuarii]|uniref:Glucokinase n=1 Tax=Palleronia aestuarii TaxID=568105 RepID=A0A2W7NC21_9RHOB|nr:glucokinase [Palleronia aestuarii]PZX17530.1 glucokinase [Palleronia aestuarii]